MKPISYSIPKQILPMISLCTGDTGLMPPLSTHRWAQTNPRWSRVSHVSHVRHKSRETHPDSESELVRGATSTTLSPAPAPASARRRSTRPRLCLCCTKVWSQTDRIGCLPLLHLPIQSAPPYIGFTKHGVCVCVFSEQHAQVARLSRYLCVAR